MATWKEGDPDPEFIEIANWAQHQHYKRRNPPWVKFYASLLDNWEFANLTDEARLDFCLLLLVASRTQNHIRNDRRYLRRLLALDRDPEVRCLLASGLLAPCYHQTESETEERRGEESQTRTREADTGAFDLAPPDDPPAARKVSPPGKGKTRKARTRKGRDKSRPPIPGGRPSDLTETEAAEILNKLKAGGAGRKGK